MGGNIYADHTSVIELKSGAITQGYARNQGGNIYMYTTAKDGVGRNSKFTVSGGEISHGTAKDRGGNIFVTTGTSNPGDCKIEVLGGQILGGKDNIILRNNGQLSVLGGTITADGYSVQFERSSNTAPTPCLTLQDSFTLGTVYMEAAEKGLICLASETVSPVKLMGTPSVRFYGSQDVHVLGAVIDTLSLNPAVRGFGYKASFQMDEAAQALLTSQGYTLWLEGGKSITRNAQGYRDQLTLRLRNFDIVNYGEAKVGAKVSLQLANGLIVESETVSYSMRDMLENISSDLPRFTADQIRAVQSMLLGYELGWNIEDLLKWTDESGAIDN